jgi:predicted Rossmann-fold nucleotide-binding protein
MLTLQHRHPVAVIGRGNVGPETDAYQTAELLGEELSERDLLIICGGELGVMEAVCRGCVKAGGIAIGVLPELVGQAIPPQPSLSRRILETPATREIRATSRVGTGKPVETG